MDDLRRVLGLVCLSGVDKLLRRCAVRPKQRGQVLCAEALLCEQVEQVRCGVKDVREPALKG